MGTIASQTFADSAGDGSVLIVQWTPLANGDSGSPLEVSAWAERSVQITGTFGTGGTVVIQGSNDGTNWATLNNAQGTGLSFTSANIKQVAEMTRYMRPNVTGGDVTTSLTVTMLIRRPNPMRT